MYLSEKWYFMINMIIKQGMTYNLVYYFKCVYVFQE